MSQAVVMEWDVDGVPLCHWGRLVRVHETDDPCRALAEGSLTLDDDCFQLCEIHALHLRGLAALRCPVQVLHVEIEEPT